MLPDYLGYQHWTSICTVPEMLSDVLPIPHADITVSVNAVYAADSDPIEGIRVYLFTATGAYQGVYADIVSEILSGKRQLNVRQIKILSKRLKVSPAVFI